MAQCICVGLKLYCRAFSINKVKRRGAGLWPWHNSCLVLMWVEFVVGFLWVLWFSSLNKNQHLQIPIVSSYQIRLKWDFGGPLQTIFGQEQTFLHNCETKIAGSIIHDCTGQSVYNIVLMNCPGIYM